MTYTRFPGVPLKPLEHPSRVWGATYWGGPGTSTIRRGTKLPLGFLRGRLPFLGGRLFCWFGEGLLGGTAFGFLDASGHRVRGGFAPARPFGDGVLFNDTESDVVRFASREGGRVFQVPRFPEASLTHLDPGDAQLARQAFARGLCVIDDDTFAAGSSPSTITLHDLRPGGKARMATLTHDVRNAIHGLEVWPFGWNVALGR